MKFSKLFSLIVLIQAMGAGLFAQNRDSVSPDKSSPLLYVKMKDQNLLIGYYVRQEGEVVLLKSDMLGDVRLDKRDISTAIALPAGIKPFEAYRYNMGQNRYFINGNSYNLKKGELLYSSVWTAINQFEYGITNYFSLGVAAFPGNLFNDVFFMNLHPKFSIPIIRNKIQLGMEGWIGNGLLLNSLDFKNFGEVNLTLGPASENLCFGMGTGDWEGTYGRVVYYSVRGALEMDKQLWLITENYFPNKKGINGVMMVGCKFVGRKVTWVTGFLSTRQPENLDVNIWVPWLSIECPIRRGKRFNFQ